MSDDSQTGETQKVTFLVLLVLKVADHLSEQGGILVAQLLLRLSHGVEGRGGRAWTVDGAEWECAEADEVDGQRTQGNLQART